MSGLTVDCYSYKERKVRPRGGKDGRVSCGRCGVNAVERSGDRPLVKKVAISVDNVGLR